MSVVIERVQVAGRDRIRLEGWIGAATPKKCKSVAGARFNKASSRDVAHWSFPLDMVVCRGLREAFGDDLQIGPELTSWARNEIRARDEVFKLHGTNAAEPVDCPLIREEAPTIWKAMSNRGYQTLVPQFAKQVGSHFNGDQPGSGKTIEELGALIEQGMSGRMLVLAPRKALRAVWSQELHKWLGADIDIDVWVADSEEGTGEDREALIEKFNAMVTPSRFQILLVNPEMTRVKPVCPKGECSGNKFDCSAKADHFKEQLHPALFSKPWDIIIADETHKYLMHGNERSASASQVGIGMQTLPSTGREYRVGMSGTPFKGKPRRFWPILHWLRPDKYTGEWRWAETYFETVPNRYAQTGKQITDNMREDRKKQFEEELGLIMIRRTKRELHAMNPAWAPPEKQFVDVRLTMDSAQRKVYKAMEDEAMVKLDGGSLWASGSLATRTRLKQFANASGKMVKVSNGDPVYRPSLPSCKWDWIKNVFLAERGLLDGDGESKVVIGSQFVEILTMYSELLNKLKVDHYMITGATNNVEAIQADWQTAGGPRVLLVSTMAGGTSLTLDAFVDDLVINDESDVPDDDEQLEDRVHRTSRTDHQVTIYRLQSEGTIDELRAENNLELDAVQKEILDGRRGVAFGRQLVGEESR